MLIVFGTYSFTLKKYTSFELGIQTEGNDDVPILLKQKVFHIFYIPVVPIEKVYTMQLSDGKLYNLPAHLHASVDERGPHRTPFYAFALPLLVMAGLLISWGVEKKHKYDRTSMHQAEQKALADSATIELDRLSPQHYIKLTDVTDKYSTENTYLKVRSIHGSSVVLEKMGFAVHYYNNNNPAFVRNFFMRHESELDTVVLPMQLLREANIAGYEDNVTDYKTPDLLHDGHKYRISSVFYVAPGPSLSIYTGDDAHTDFSLVMLRNMGDPARLVEIRDATDSSIHIREKLPMQIRTDNSESHFELRVEGNAEHDYEATLILEDSLHKHYQYRLEWDHIDWIVRPVTQ
ncbi:MAG: hypothetical protein JWO03_2095 [Bacteroidetes bacterium]|nr:hypothetical protein [Bacteroidota bacterium]